ncbi:MAG TPA: rhomboid family intramembrane serine protease [Candidatus Dojkabacteria bacterium]|nr:rhomboid family intramembrane serine protease [Candidatus Dojkabacteria bacterium]
MFPLSDDKTYKFPIVNILIIATCIFVFIIQISAVDFDVLVNNYALVPWRINILNFSTWWPFVSSIFMHGSLMHIGSNLWFLWIFGDNVEEDLGSLNYLFFYLIGGIFAGFAQYLLSTKSLIPMLGASGAISAVMGYYMVAFPANRVRVLTRYGSGYVPAYSMLLSWILLQLLSTVGSLASGRFMGGGVAWMAHVSGFAFGFLSAKLLKR